MEIDTYTAAPGPFTVSVGFTSATPPIMTLWSETMGRVRRTKNEALLSSKRVAARRAKSKAARQARKRR